MAELWITRLFSTATLRIKRAMLLLSVIPAKAERPSGEGRVERF
jgi:hypothetical protein